MQKNSYVLITPARNEQDYIQKTIESVVSQTILPEKWVIVSDGSTDHTDEIVSHYAAKHDFIQFIRVSEHIQRNFWSKVHAFNAGYEQIKNTEYKFLGNLDADVSFNSNYYENVLLRFQTNPKLGIAGGIILELLNGQYVNQKLSLNSVAGAIQLFRRECYQDIGGYIPLTYGGVDSAA
ncbi:MAG: glycosyltransferase, partial [Candidatus Hodarchaeota archaeon]